ncbi:universal stress protein [Streptomyces caniferus]|uniref:universal stress protein n=1 Tax=Streptomyces caniferus TaxID=285557 RepID=UPI0033E02F0D
MELPLVVGIDGSADALRAVDWAADEAALRDCPLHLLYASIWEPYEGPAFPVGALRQLRPAGTDRTVAAAAEERARLRSPDIAVTADECDEDPVYALIDASDRAAAIVVGSRGHGLPGIVLGSVSLTVAARAHCPVIVERAGAQFSVDDRWVVLGLGGPGNMIFAAVEFAFEEAALRGCGVEVVHAWTRRHRERATVRGGRFDETRIFHEQRAKEWLDDALARPTAAYPDLPVRRVVVESHARPVLLQAASQADLLVVGAQRRRNALGLQLGLVNHAMLHYAPCTVAVVPAKDVKKSG